jgi:uncharacterized protein
LGGIGMNATCTGEQSEALENELKPTSPQSRSLAVDVTRAIALLGIFLVNVEFFSRQLGGRGIDADAQGLDRWIGGFVYYLVEGKVWIIFAILFGVGMGQTMQRCETLGRSICWFQVRRILGLATLGALHCILLWRGDILFLYALSASVLLLLLFAKARIMILAIALAALVGVVSRLDTKGAWAVCFISIGIAGMFVRSEFRIRVLRRQWNVSAVFFFLAASAILTMTLVRFFLSQEAQSTRNQLNLTLNLIRCVLVFSLGCAACWLYRSKNDRMLTAAIALYTFPALMTLSTATATYVSHHLHFPSEAMSVEPNSGEKGTQRSSRLPLPQLTPEALLMKDGTYWQCIRWRSSFFVRNALGEATLVTPTVALFLLGVWFVRSNAVSEMRSARGLVRFRRLAWIGLPIGYGLSSCGKMLEAFDVSHSTPGLGGIAANLTKLGSLLASLGWIGLVVMIATINESNVAMKLLARTGQMGLTNYVTQSLVCSTVFYGYGLGYWGMGRTSQVVMVLIVFAIQILVSNLWLARFRYGPIETVWRAMTYR